MNFDGKTTIAPVSLLGSTTMSTATTVYSAAVQPSGFRYAMFLFNSYYASGTIDMSVSLQDSEDGVSFTDIGSTVAPSQAATIVGANSFLVRHEACRNYVRLRVTRNSGATVIVGVTAMRYGKINAGATSDIGLGAQ